MRKLLAKGALRLAERSRGGHVVKVRLPEEIRSLRAGKIAARRPGCLPSEANLVKADTVEARALRQAIHAREGGFCFCCLRRMGPMVRCLDHVVPRVRRGRDSYGNLVSSCLECNSQKRAQRAEDFLRWLYREGRLSAGDFSGRLRALVGLAAGKLRPPLEIRKGQEKDPTTEVHSRKLKSKATRNSKLEIRNWKRDTDALPKKLSRGASLRGQGTPADPARLRSVRARNSANLFAPQANKSGENLACGFLLLQIYRAAARGVAAR